MITPEARRDKLFVAADVKSEDGRVWELIGVFDSYALAREACTERNHGFFPVELNQRAPDQTTEAPGMVWPNVPSSELQQSES